LLGQLYFRNLESAYPKISTHQNASKNIKYPHFSLKTPKNQQLKQREWKSYGIRGIQKRVEIKLFLVFFFKSCLSSWNTIEYLLCVIEILTLWTRCLTVQPSLLEVDCLMMNRELRFVKTEIFGVLIFGLMYLFHFDLYGRAEIFRFSNKMCFFIIFKLL
jgi:hypothetical protein